jgi:superfamily II DNA or RNA helicase
MLAQLPTGGGKGRILAAATARTVANGKRITLMAHRAELVEQICRNLDDEGVPHGRIMPGWPTMRYPVRVGMVQTIARRVNGLEAPDLLLVDEAHHAPASQYVAIAKAWSAARVLGVTATPIRTDGQGLADHFDALVIGPSVADLIRDGFLAQYDYYVPKAGFSMDGARKVAGDYSQSDALAIMDKAKIVGDAIGHYRQRLGGRPAIAFCMGIEHCERVAADFVTAGIASLHVDGQMSLADRAQRLQMLADGRLMVLTAADVISEGVDIPTVAGAILLRPTMSTGLFLQQVGRALRPKPDGSRAVILDHVDNRKRHGLPADPRKWSLDGLPKLPPPAIRECDVCHRVFPREDARAIAMDECEKDAEDCGILRPGKGRPQAGVIAGELEAVADAWAWTGGIDPILAHGDEYKALLSRAKTRQQLDMIARARGYKPGWAWRVMQDRANTRTQS